MVFLYSNRPQRFLWCLFFLFFALSISLSLSIQEYHMALQKYCTNDTYIRKCLDNATFSFSSTIKKARKGYTPDGPGLMNPSLWIPEITLPASGKCYTLNTSLTLEEDLWLGHLSLIWTRIWTTLSSSMISTILQIVKI